MSVFVSDERFKVDSLLQMARLEGDSKKRDEYVREAKEILKSVGRDVSELSEEELRAKRKMDYARSKLIGKLQNKGQYESYYPYGYYSKEFMIDRFEDNFCMENGTIKEFLHKALNELVNEKVIAIKYNARKDASDYVGSSRLTIYICDGEAAQWYL